MIKSLYHCNYSEMNSLFTRLFGSSLADDGVGVRNEYKFVPVEGSNKFFTELDVDLISYIEATYDDNFYILLNDTLEANWNHKWLDKLHTDLKKSTIDPTTIYYFTNTLDASEQYEKYCIERNISIKNRINFFSFPFLLLQVWIAMKNFKEQSDRSDFWSEEVNTWTKYKSPQLERDFSIIPQKKFVNLNSVKKAHRQIFVDFIRNSNFDENEIYYSVGWEKKYLHGMGDLTEIEKYYNSWNDELNIYEAKVPDHFQLCGNPAASAILETRGVGPLIYYDTRPFYWDSFFSIVSETLPGTHWTEDEGGGRERKEGEYRIETTPKFPFMTDKINGAILCSSLFLIVAEHGALKFLRKCGFKTFSDVIDESYDDEPDINKRINMITNQVSELYNKSNEELYDILLAAEDTINYNFRYIQEPSLILDTLQESLKELIEIGRTPYHNPDEIFISIYDDVDLDHSNIELFMGCQTSLKFILINPKEDKFVQLVLDALPDQVTLVPDSNDQLTSDHGWDTISEIKFLKETIEVFKSKGIRSSIFVDADPNMVSGAADTGTDRIELYTENYAKEYLIDPKKAIDPFVNAALKANELNIEINAGHDLDLKNLNYFSKNIKGLKEVSIGHALISDALLYGMETTIKKYLLELNRS